MITYVIQSACGCHFETSPTGQVFRWCPLHKAAPEMYEALKEISQGKGRFSLDQLKHAENTIEDMKELALAALAKVEGRVL